MLVAVASLARIVLILRELNLLLNCFYFQCHNCL